MTKKRDKKVDQWELESPFDRPASLDELVEAQPFTEAGGADSVTAGTRIPRWLYRRAMKLVETTGSPYEVVSDVYRDAIYIGLRIIFTRLKSTQDWAVESRLANIAMDAEVMKRTRSQVNILTSGLDNLLKEDEPEKAAEELTRYVSTAMEMENEWVKRRLFKMLREDEVVNRVLKYCSKEVQKLVKETGVERHASK